MAINIQYDLNLGGISGSYDRAGDGFNITHLVTGVTGLTAADKILAVKNALISDGFIIGAFADSASGAWLHDVQVRPIGSPPEPDKFVATLIYRSNPFSEVKIESSVSLSQISTNIDIFGNPVTLQYQYSDPFEADSELAGKLVPQGGLFDKLVPEIVVVLRVRQLEDPVIQAPLWVGKTNSEWWRGGAPGEWMCMGITGQNDLSQPPYEYFNAAYTFQRRLPGITVSSGIVRDAWNPRVVFIDKTDGKPPADVEDSGQPDAVKYPIIYDEADFNFLFDYS